MDLNLGYGQLSDDEFVSAFDQCRLEPANFHHADHVRLAWIYAARCSPVEAEQKLMSGIQRFAAKAGVPGKFQYTTTLAWARLVVRARKRSDGRLRFDQWITAHPEFLDRQLLQKYYSRGLLETEPARSAWVAPNLASFD